MNLISLIIIGPSAAHRRYRFFGLRMRVDGTLVARQCDQLDEGHVAVLAFEGSQVDV